MICERFTSDACVNGHCPIALGDGDRTEIKRCDECCYHTACRECLWEGTEECKKYEESK